MREAVEKDRGRPAVRATGLVKNYDNVRALDELEIEIQAGTIHGLLGPNGAGKSTLVSALSTLITLEAGTAEVAGLDVSADPGQVRRRIGLVGQSAALDEILGGRQNLVMFAQLFGLSRRDAARRADELLAGFGLAEAGERPASTYSGGMRRRLDIAVGMILDPQVLFLDEPTTGLDPRGRIDVWNSVTAIAERGTTVLLTTQYLEEVDALADRISIMKSGRIIAEGTPTALKRARGGDRIEVTGATASEARAIRTALVSTDGPEIALDEDTGVVTCPAAGGAGDLSAVVRRLDAAGIVADDIVLRRPTLDEVFLALTEKEDA
ncbi:ATP-binding cassette domain-containing protein [Brevibacterium sediminis]|uniref:ATP-binding cassette domain-containing protein n=1 Tax=Brevibacterium sediminis TaxID=1857024 RepID=UPI003B3BD8A7